MPLQISVEKWEFGWNSGKFVNENQTVSKSGGVSKIFTGVSFYLTLSLFGECVQQRVFC